MDKGLIEKELVIWKVSPYRKKQIDGQRYYDNDHDINYRKREAIGDKGELTEIKNLPNNHVIDNRYRKLVDQKANYLLGKPFAIDTKNKTYAEHLKSIFGRRFKKLLKNAGKYAMNSGICWLYPYYDSDGEFRFKLFKGCDVLPFWTDEEHTKIDMAVRLYKVRVYNKAINEIVEKAEVYCKDGVYRYTVDGSRLIPDDEMPYSPYAYISDKAFNWERIPLIPIKYSDDEQPLLNKVRSLQDGVNLLLSDFENNMQEDSRNTVIVLKNYDGENLGEFRRNLATFGAVKVRYDGDTKGGVETLQITVNAENYKVILDLFRKAIIENGLGFDAKDDRLSGNPNQMNIQSMYSDIDLDANDMEMELQAVFEDVLWFVNCHLASTGKGSYFDEGVDIIFNRDILINESQVISDIKNSVGILSEKTLVSQHPYVEDIDEELERIKQEQPKEYEPFMASESGAL